MWPLLMSLISGVAKKKMGQAQQSRDQPIGGGDFQLQGMSPALSSTPQQQQQAHPSVGTNFLSEILGHVGSGGSQPQQGVQSSTSMYQPGYSPSVPNSPAYGVNQAQGGEAPQTSSVEDWLNHILSGSGRGY